MSDTVEIQPVSSKYPSIETVWVRDPITNRLNFGDIRSPEALCVKSWRLTEKIDGTNVRVIYTPEGRDIRGRTDNATLHPHLIKAVDDIMPPLEEVMNHFLGMNDPKETWRVTFYGEGYGAGIQKNGGRYSQTKRFRCFDIRFGTDNWWLDDDEMRDACQRLGVPTVPILAEGMDAFIPLTRADLFSVAPFSIVAKEEGDSPLEVEPEGIVAKPMRSLFDKHGNRVMWKLTYREFR